VDFHIPPAEGPFIVLDVFPILVLISSAAIVAPLVPCEWHVFFISARQKSNIVDHFSQYPSGICSTAESEDIDVVAIGVISHKKFVTSNHMFSERECESFV
jgi:hypothetical protein